MSVLNCGHPIGGRKYATRVTLNNVFYGVYVCCEKCWLDGGNFQMRIMNFVRETVDGIHRSTLDCGHLQNGNPYYYFEPIYPELVKKHPEILYAICSECHSNEDTLKKHSLLSTSREWDTQWRLIYKPRAEPPISSYKQNVEHHVKLMKDRKKLLKNTQK